VRRKIEIVRSRSTAFPFRPSRSAHTNLAEAAESIWPERSRGRGGTGCCVLALQRSADPIRYRDPFNGARTEKHGAGLCGEMARQHPFLL
jgi:hypothetical protein